MMDHTEPAQSQAGPPISASSTGRDHTTAEAPEESSADHESPPSPPPAVLDGVDLTTAVSPLDLTSPGLPAAPLQDNPHTISRVLNPAGEESTEYFTANNGEGNSGNLSEQNLQLALRVQLSNHTTNGGVPTGSYLRNGPNSMMVPYMTHSTTVDDSSSSGFSVASYSSHFSSLEASESASMELAEEPPSLDGSPGSLVSHNSLIDESHSPPQPITESQFREEFNSRGSVRNQVSRVVSVRLNPPDRFIEDMENRLMRYQSSITGTNNEDLLSGNHLFQSPTLQTHSVLQINNNSNQQKRPVSKRLIEEITDRNRRSSSTLERFIANIPAPFQRSANTLQSFSLELSSSTHNDDNIRSFGSNFNSLQSSNGSPFGFSLKRGRENSTENENEDNVVVHEDVDNNPTDTDNQSTLIVSKEMSTMPRNGYISLIHPHCSLNPSVTDGSSTGREPDTAELLMNWELSNGTRATTTTITNSTERRGNSRDNRSSALLPPSIGRNLKIHTQETTVQVQTQVGGFQRSPISRTEPQTTSATQLEMEELRKLQGQVPDGIGENNNSNWLVALWRTIIAPFSC